jgi:DNA-binding GntR family transcriptional regulator
MKGKSALHETLRRQILTLELEPDQDLDEVRLSEEYGISRTPVRDVLRQLAVEGYVDIRENRGARVVPMNHATLRDFFLVAPMIYEAIGRLAVQNWRANQFEALKACQERFRTAIAQNDAEKMVVENNRFHELIGEMAGSVFLKPTLNRLLIDHARIGHTFFRPSTDDMAVNLAKSCAHHDEMITALAERNETAMVSLVFDHWDLSRQNMELFIAPRALKSETTAWVFSRDADAGINSN